MNELSRINSPADVRALTAEEAAHLADEIRSFLVASVSQTGGHLGPNLGVVELTIAIHRIFESPQDTIVFDTGHQAYVHKLLTGRRDFTKLRSRGGLSGYPSRAESPHDVVENSHASTALSWADGIARAHQLQGESERHVVAVIGDGALTGGMAWEALNNISADQQRRLVIVVNDNGRSYAPTIGGLAHQLDTLRTTRTYEEVLGWGKRTLQRGGTPGKLVYDALRGAKRGVRNMLLPQGIFEGLGIKYLGPVDGHDLLAMEEALGNAKEFGGPVIVHAITQKGRGYVPAETDEADRFHAVGVIHPETGLPVQAERFGWTAVFADEMVRLAQTDSRIVAITAAMREPVGLAPLAEHFPERVIDVGIAEQHALTAAAGMAFAGLHPVVALYATFLNRAFDQLLMDVALHGAGVTLVLDRAGLTGSDGASHNGQWDMAMARLIPGLRLATPRDEPRLRRALQEAVKVEDAATVVRYPKGALPAELPALAETAAGEILAQEQGTGTVYVVGYGPYAATAAEVAHRLGAQGYGATALAPLWAWPISSELLSQLGEADLVVTIEDGLASGGLGAGVLEALQGQGRSVPVLVRGIPSQFLSHATRAELEEELGLRAQAIANDALARLGSPWEPLAEALTADDAGENAG